MGQIRLGAIAPVLRRIALISSFLTIGAFTAAPTSTSAKQPQQVAQVESQCRGGQILQARACVGDGTEPEEQKLHQLVNQYRARYGLPSIPLSPSLSLVANRHVRDLEENIRELTHGWSDCPYDGNNRSTWPCMWEAPQRLGTSYPGRGYENAHGGTGGYRASAESALESWQGSSAHNAVILNQGMWQNRQWNALGIGIYKGYAVLWFGEEPDPATAQRSQGQQNETVSCPLTGNWNYRQAQGWEYWKGQGFVGEGHIDSPTAYYSTKLVLKENPRQIETSSFVPNQNGGLGTLQGNRLSLSLPVANGAAQLVGTVSPDRQTVQGNITFVDGKTSGRQVTIPFAMQRETPCGSEPASGSERTTPRNTNPTQPPSNTTHPSPIW
ncbi:MAG: CAP domain-containing protein [Oscillatoria sp. SIO1A7]|nr:CAP domain-containing protein [Oscillatoria sp. SIO1A7]